MKKYLLFMAFFLVGLAPAMYGGFSDCCSSLCAAIRSFCGSRPEAAVVYSVPHLLPDQPMAVIPPRQPITQAQLQEFAVPLPRPRTPRAVKVKVTTVSFYQRKSLVDGLSQMFPGIETGDIVDFVAEREAYGPHARFQTYQGATPAQIAKFFEHECQRDTEYNNAKRAQQNALANKAAATCQSPKQDS